jgi:hypothetical protein
VGSAAADPVPSWTTSCTDTFENSPGGCERLTYIATEQAAIEQDLLQAHADSQSETDRLDLVWGGVWFAAGISFGVWFFAPLAREARRWGNESA